MDGKVEKFEIKNPLWVLYTVVVFTILCLSIATVLTVLFCVNIIEFKSFIISMPLVALFVIGLVFCLVGYVSEKFIFNDETFTYSNFLGRKRSVKVEDLAYVNLRFNGFVKVKEFSYVKLYAKGNVEIEMVDKNGKIVFKFSDYYGTAFKNGLFGMVLTQRNIEVKEIF